MKINRRRKQPDGRYKDENTVLTIDIKQGWKEGTKITFHNEGSEKPGISAGDVVFKIKERFLNHYFQKFFNVDGFQPNVASFNIMMSVEENFT